MAQKPLMFIVEDDPAWAATLTKSKLSKAFTIKHFTKGEEAIEALKKEKPEITILDYHLEGKMTGLDTLKAIKERSPKTYVIMFTAQEDVQTAVDLMQNGAFDYVIKSPTALNKIRIIINKIARHQAAQQELITLRLRFRRSRLMLYSLLILAAIVITIFLIQL